MEHGPGIEGMAVCAPAFESGVEVPESHLGEKAERSKIDTENRRARRSKDSSHGKQRSVTTEHNNKCRRVGRHFGTIDDGSGLTIGASLTIEQGVVSMAA